MWYVVVAVLSFGAGVSLCQYFWLGKSIREHSVMIEDHKVAMQRLDAAITEAVEVHQAKARLN